MKVWILSDHDLDTVTDDNYEVRRFREEAALHGVDLSILKPERFEVFVGTDGRNRLLVDGNEADPPDFFLPRPEGIRRAYLSQAVMRQIEKMGVVCMNSVDAALTVADKMHTHQILADSGVPTPATMLASAPIDMKIVERTVGYPVVVKTLSGTNGRGIFLAENERTLKDAVELALEANPRMQMIFQQFVSYSHGRDLRLFVLDGRVIACMERMAQDGSFKANFSRGGAVRSFDPDDKAVSLALYASKILGLDIAGIDLLFTPEGGYTVCEANAFPGFRGLESCCDINVPSAIYNAMRQRLWRYKKGKSWKSLLRWIRAANTQDRAAA